MKSHFLSKKFNYGLGVKVRNKQNKHFMNSGFKISRPEPTLSTLQFQQYRLYVCHCCLLAQYCLSIWTKVYVQNLSSGILHHYHLTRESRSPVRIIAQVQWFMYQSRLEPSIGILHR